RNSSARRPSRASADAPAAEEGAAALGPCFHSVSLVGSVPPACCNTAASTRAPTASRVANAEDTLATLMTVGEAPNVVRRVSNPCCSHRHDTKNGSHANNNSPRGPLVEAASAQGPSSLEADAATSNPDKVSRASITDRTPPSNLSGNSWPS
ncbi:unnamed protein product, partial [Ectocarpus sp. 8 AP-2014]